jgi:hypothetical protein
MRRVITFAVRAAAMVALAATGFSILESHDSPDGCGGVGLLGEPFDRVKPPALPPGWVGTNAIDPDGIFWVTSNSGNPSPPADSLPNGAFINDPSAISDKRLDSPPIFESQGTGCAQVTFQNNFDFQDGLDGGVLEVSFDSGATFEDVLTAGNFTTGGYNGTISNCCSNPLAGRQAWTGNSGGFITTTVEVGTPVGPYLVLRWRMGSDIGGSGQGWRIDTVLVEQPDKPTPPPETPTPTPTITPTPTLTPRPAPSSKSRPTPHPRPTPPR